MGCLMSTVYSSNIFVNDEKSSLSGKNGLLNSIVIHLLFKDKTFVLESQKNILDIYLTNLGMMYHMRTNQMKMTLLR
jgi:hypothetical protein